MEYTVVVERTSNNYAAYVPDLPGCVATANTREELLEETREAIEFHIEGMREHGEVIHRTEWREQQAEAAKLDAAIEENLARLRFGTSMEGTNDQAD